MSTEKSRLVFDVDTKTWVNLPNSRNIKPLKSLFKPKEKTSLINVLHESHTPPISTTNPVGYIPIPLEPEAPQSQQMKGFNTIEAQGANTYSPPHSRLVTAGYPNYPASYGGGRHHGIDFGIPEGTLLGAVDKLKIISMAIGGYNGGCGTFIRAKGLTTGRYFTYMHMSAIRSGLRVGSVVEYGDFIGKSGNTGNSTGPHLHFQIDTSPNSYTSSINPTNFAINHDYILNPKSGGASGTASAISNSGSNSSKTATKPKKPSKSKVTIESEDLFVEGDLELIPSYFTESFRVNETVNVKNVGALNTSSYYITNVKKSLSSSGYTQSIKLFSTTPGVSKKIVTSSSTKPVVKKTIIKVAKGKYARIFTKTAKYTNGKIIPDYIKKQKHKVITYASNNTKVKLSPRNIWVYTKDIKAW